MNRRVAVAAALVLALGLGMLGGWLLGAPGTHPTAAAPPSTAAPQATATPAPPTSAPSRTAAPGQHRIALLGDGLLDGTGLPDTQCLPILLGRARQEFLIVDLGIGHESSDKVLTRVRDASEQHLDAAVIWVGSYDAAAGNSPKQYAASMAAILDAFKGTRVVLLPPIAVPGGADVGPYAAALAQVATQRGIAVADISAITRNPDWQSGAQDLGPNADAALVAFLARQL
jgi:hypothetical protein